MDRSFTVLLFKLILALSAAETSNGPTVLGSFQKVHIEPISTNDSSTTIFIRDANFTQIDGEERPESPHRIVGGRVVDITEVPWQAALIKDRQFGCGGSVISTIWVLTAGHCLFGFGRSKFFVRAGSNTFRSGGQIRRVGLMAVHGQYVPTQVAYDIGMVRVTQRFVFGSTVQPIQVATANTRIPNVFFVSGWGSIRRRGGNPSRLLRGVNVNFINRRICTTLYAETNETDLNNSICAGNLQGGGRDSCEGDSGGPLASNGVLFGVVSLGIGCGQARFPGIYTDVGAMNTWILNVARSLSTKSSHQQNIVKEDAN